MSDDNEDLQLIDGTKLSLVASTPSLQSKHELLEHWLAILEIAYPGSRTFVVMVTPQTDNPDSAEVIAAGTLALSVVQRVLNDHPQNPNNQLAAAAAGGAATAGDPMGE